MFPPASTGGRRNSSLELRKFLSLSTGALGVLLTLNIFFSIFLRGPGTLTDRVIFPPASTGGRRNSPPGLGKCSLTFRRGPGHPLTESPIPEPLFRPRTWPFRGTLPPPGEPRTRPGAPPVPGNPPLSTSPADALGLRPASKAPRGPGPIVHL